MVSRAAVRWPSWSTCAVVVAALGTLVSVSAPAVAGQFRRRQALKLVEYSDPGFARRGTLTEFVYAGRPAPPYGYGYQIRFKINGICRRPNVQLASGKGRAWVQGYDYGPPGTFLENLYADAVAVFPYGSSATDGSFGTDTLCGGRRESRRGTVRVYRRAAAYQWIDNGFYHAYDVLLCSDELGCNWFAGYSRQRPETDYALTP